MAITELVHPTPPFGGGSLIKVSGLSLHKFGGIVLSVAQSTAITAVGAHLGFNPGWIYLPATMYFNAFVYEAIQVATDRYELGSLLAQGAAQGLATSPGDPLWRDFPVAYTLVPGAKYIVGYQTGTVGGGGVYAWRQFMWPPFSPPLFSVAPFTVWGAHDLGSFTTGTVPRLRITT
jgi:hypothetical protein